MNFSSFKSKAQQMNQFSNISQQQHYQYQRIQNGDMNTNGQNPNLNGQNNQPPIQNGQQQQSSQQVPSNGYNGQMPQTNGQSIPQMNGQNGQGNFQPTSQQTYYQPPVNTVPPVNEAQLISFD